MKILLLLSTVLAAYVPIRCQHVDPYNKPNPTARNIFLETTSETHVDIQNDYPTFVHLAEKAPVGGFWQYQVVNIGPGRVYVDAGMMNHELTNKRINGKKEPVVVPPGCYVIFVRDGSDYAWDAKPITLSQGILVNSRTCKEQPEQRPYTAAELAQTYEDGVVITPHTAPAWVDHYEAGMTNCVQISDLSQVKQDFSDVRKAMLQGDKTAFHPLAERFLNWYHIYYDSKRPQRAPDCRAGLDAARMDEFLDAIRRSGMSGYDQVVR